ncbi:MAG TPA: 2-C-methyl-D-erythritol 4-phosphate cytidylyltransferase [Ktedonobacterales bacterium]|nr:2-C-methyl-D-erythritol 4-phosphate cytidylyltransferase [Ktedonobacterales bacterium]
MSSEPHAPPGHGAPTHENMSAFSEDTQKAGTVAVILCAGQGTRMGATQNKVFLPLLGKPLLVYTIEAFQRARTVDEIVLVAHPDEVDFCREEIVRKYGLVRVRHIFAGGASRHQSEQRALEALRGRIEGGEIGVILVHDGARPFVPPVEIDALIRLAREEGGALLASAVAADETIARVDENGCVAAILPAHDLWRAQTPQAFAAPTLLAAYDAARADGFEGTDTAATFERAGNTVRVLAGSPDNFKVTTPDDLLRAERIARALESATRGAK